MNYSIAEIFHSVQGEGVHTGTPMTFIRTVGCSVGKKICQHCDTDFDRTYPWLGGGEFNEDQLAAEIPPNMQHVNITGGEPLNWDLRPLIQRIKHTRSIHIETSGTVQPDWLGDRVHSLERDSRFSIDNRPTRLWITMSPKPGFIPSWVIQASEIKVIVGGLGNGDGWPSINDARKWAHLGIPVFLQPRNSKLEISRGNLALCMDLVMKYPELRLSPQLHKFLTVR